MQCFGEYPLRFVRNHRNFYLLRGLHGQIRLKWSKHYYAEIRNNIELFNGFQLWTGVSYHRRIPVKKKSDISNPGEGIEEIINDNYHDFTPVVGFSYTPRQYYWMDGYRKEYLYSYYPTISVEFARAIPGVGKSSGDYGRSRSIVGIR